MHIILRAEDQRTDNSSSGDETNLCKTYVDKKVFGIREQNKIASPSWMFFQWLIKWRIASLACHWTIPTQFRERCLNKRIAITHPKSDDMKQREFSMRRLINLIRICFFAVFQLGGDEGLSLGVSKFSTMPGKPLDQKKWVAFPDPLSPSFQELCGHDAVVPLSPSSKASFRIELPINFRRPTDMDDGTYDSLHRYGSVG